MPLTFEWMELESVTRQIEELADLQRTAEGNGKPMAAEVLSLDISVAEQRREQLMAAIMENLPPMA
jgi:hypothetical protein